MPWTTPETFTAGQTLTAASMNIVSGNAGFLYKPPMCRVYRTTDVNPYTSATAIAWDAEDYDSDSMHSTATNTSRVTITAAGVYLITFHANITPTGSPTFWPVLAKNGTSLTVGNGNNISEAGNYHMSMSWIGSLAVSDYIEARVSGSGGSAYVLKSGTGLNGSWLDVSWIGNPA